MDLLLVFYLVWLPCCNVETKQGLRCCFSPLQLFLALQFLFDFFLVLFCFFFKVQVFWILITHFRQTCIQNSVVNKEGKSRPSLPISSFENWVIEAYVCLLDMTQASPSGFSARRHRRGGDERRLPAAILVLPSRGEGELQHGQQHHPLLWY